MDSFKMEAVIISEETNKLLETGEKAPDFTLPDANAEEALA